MFLGDEYDRNTMTNKSELLNFFPELIYARCCSPFLVSATIYLSVQIEMRAMVTSLLLIKVIYLSIMNLASYLYYTTLIYPTHFLADLNKRIHGP